MAGNACEAFVTFEDFPVRAADAGHRHPDQGLVLAWLGHRRLMVVMERAVKKKRPHIRSTLSQHLSGRKKKARENDFFLTLFFAIIAIRRERPTVIAGTRANDYLFYWTADRLDYGIFWEDAWI